jgi:hypothetical protein
MSLTLGSFTSGGETGTTTCFGPINGKQPTGTGSRGEEGRLLGPDRGEATFSFTLPTTGGDQHIAGPATLTYAPLQNGGLFGGTIEGRRLHGTFQVMPLTKDPSMASPVRFHVHCDEWVVDAKSET